MGCLTICCSSKIAKIILVVTNTFFFLLGAILLVFGILARWFQDVLLLLFSYIPDQIMEDIYQGWDIPDLLGDASALLIVIGIIVFPIGVCGMYGAFSENRCALILYVTVISGCLAIELAAVVIIAVLTSGAEENVINFLQQSIQTNYFDSDGGFSIDEDGKFNFAIRPVKLAWDGVQVVMGCCGAVNASDYINANFQGEYNITINGSSIAISDAQVPMSCCNFIDSKEYEDEREDFEPDSSLSMYSKRRKLSLDAFVECLDEVSPEYTHQQGCYQTFLDLIWDYWIFFLSFCTCIIIAEILSLVCTSNLIRKGNRRKSFEDIDLQ